jgi:hypothetical protein
LPPRRGTVRRRGRKWTSFEKVETGREGGRERRFVEEKVVRRSRVDGGKSAGRKALIDVVRSAIVDVDGRGIDKMEGRERPGKDVRRALIVAMFLAGFVSLGRKWTVSQSREFREDRIACEDTET